MTVNQFNDISSKVVVAGAAAALFLGANMATGTGGEYVSTNTKNWVSHPYFDHRWPSYIEFVKTPSLDVRTIVEHIENIKNTFDITISNIADMLNVSRQAVYKWLANTSTPEKDKQELLKTFSYIADKFEEAGIKRSKVLLKMKAFNGRCLIDIVLAGESLDTYVNTLIEEAKIMEEAYKKSGLAESKSKPNNYWRSSISIPGFPEKE